MVKPYYLEISHSIMQQYKNVTISGDVMFVNRIPFMLMVARLLLMGTVENIPSTKLTYTLKAVESVTQLYNKRGFKIVRTLLDGKFEPLRGELSTMGIDVNIVSAEEHIPEIERYTRTVKERTRAIHNSLPFKQFPTRVIIKMLRISVYWLNAFPRHSGVSRTMSPSQIVTGPHPPYSNTLLRPIWNVLSSTQ